MVTLAEKLLQTQDEMEEILDYVDRRLDLKGTGYKFDSMEEASSFFIARQAGIAVEMAVLLCKHSSGKPSDSRKVCSPPYLETIDLRRKY